MNTSFRLLLGGGSMLCLAFLAWGQQNPELPKAILVDPPAQEGIEVQTRGPVHEAFLQPVDTKPSASQPVPKAPPPLIKEEPPTERPDGKNVVWISGYWGWDPMRQDYTWVSGLYREAPEGMQFIPGQWIQSGGEWVRSPGFWAPITQAQAPFVPQPPAPLDESIPQTDPSSDSFYVPGQWLYRSNYYAWQPGYYALRRPGRIWTPSHYVWAGPSNYIYCDGYWDYELENRGLLYAPVVFSQPYWNDPSWYYTPGYCIRPYGLYDNLFCNGLSFSFFFGNYYDPFCDHFGFHPWWHSPWHHDNFYAHEAWRHHNDHDWHNHLEHNFNERRAGHGGPPLTLAHQNALARTGGVNNVLVAHPNQVAALDHVKVNQTTVNQLNVAKNQAQVQRETVAERQTSLANANGKGAGNGGFKLPADTAAINNAKAAKSGRNPDYVIDSGKTGNGKGAGNNVSTAAKGLDKGAFSSKGADGTVGKGATPKGNPVALPKGLDGTNARSFTNDAKGPGRNIEAKGGPAGKGSDGSAKGSGGSAKGNGNGKSSATSLNTYSPKGVSSTLGNPQTRVSTYPPSANSLAAPKGGNPNIVRSGGNVTLPSSAKAPNYSLKGPGPSAVRAANYSAPRNPGSSAPRASMSAVSRSPSMSSASRGSAPRGGGGGRPSGGGGGGGGKGRK